MSNLGLINDNYCIIMQDVYERLNQGIEQIYRSKAELKKELGHSSGEELIDL